MHQNTSEIKQFIHDKSYLFWYIKDEAKENISIDFLVETMLNYGDEKDVKRLFDIIGIDSVAEIFYKQISGKRNNYRPRTIHYFPLYFNRHAQRSAYKPAN